MNKDKILVFTTTFPRWRGDSKPPFVYELSKRLSKNFDVSVLTPNCQGARAFESMDGMKIFRFRYFFKKLEKLVGGSGIIPTLSHNKLHFFLLPFFLLGEFFSLSVKVRKLRPKVIHAHWIPNGFFAALVKRIYRVSLVVTAHGSDVHRLQGSFFTILNRFTLKNADRITVVSNALKNELLNKINPNLAIEVISMGVDSTLFSPDKRDESLKKKYNINGPFLLFVGRLVEIKGVEYLIKAMANIIKEYPNAKLLIIGNGIREKELKDLTSQLHLSSNIIFTGNIPNPILPSYYATADIFIGPSVTINKGGGEGLNLCLIEAAMSECVIIGSNVAGINEVITDNTTGFLVEQKNPDDISKKVIDVLKDQSLADRIRKLARKEMIKRFDWEVVARKYEKVFKNCIY